MQNNTSFILGLLTGDGSFQINHWKKKYLQYRVVIKLKSTSLNLKMLQDQREYYKFGTIVPSDKSVVWAINHKKQVHQLLNLLVENPLSLYKYLNHLKMLKMIYCIENNVSYSEYLFLEKDVSEWRWPFKKPAASTIPIEFTENFKWWLSGLVEAEGCFCIRKNGNQSFSVSQKNDRLIIDSVKTFFEIPNKVIQKKYGTLVVETFNSRCCFKVSNFFEKYPLRGEKISSFNRFKTHLYLKYGNE